MSGSDDAAARPFAAIEGKYEILEKMREGGMGAVYRVRHRLLDEVRVIKVMRPHLASDPTLRARFLREAKVAIRMRNRNLAQLYDFTVDDDGYAFIVMEHIKGPNLVDLVKASGPPSLGLTLEIACQALDVLGYLHRKGVIHRDIAPDNLILTRDEEQRPLVKLIDLGIAKTAKTDENLTAVGTFLGKVRYTSPEQLTSREGAGVDRRSDLYSLAIVVYEMLTGCSPIPGSGTTALIAAHLTRPPIGFDTTDPTGAVPEGVRQAVLRCLAKSPADRFDDAAAFKHALQPFRDQHPVDAEELQRVFEAPARTTERIRVHGPGSTQDHLDRGFALDHAEPGDASDHREAIEQVEASDHPEAGGHEPEAGREPPEATGMPTSSPGAGAAGEPAPPILSAEERRRLEVETTTRAIAAQIEAEEIDEARRAIEMAEKLYGSEPFSGLREQLDRVVDDRAQAEAKRLRIEAEGLMEAGRLAEAVAVLQRALEVAPQHSRTMRTLARAKKALHEQQAEVHRQEQIRSALAGIGRLVAVGRFDPAERRLAALEAEHPDAPTADLRTALTEAHDELRERQSRAFAALQTARQLAEQGSFDAAGSHLDQARGPAEELAEVQQLVTETEGLIQRLQKERRRQLEVDRVAEVIRTHLDSAETDEGRLDQAEHELEVAGRLYGHRDVLLELREELEQAREQRRRQRVAQLLDLASSQHPDLEQAIATLEQARELDPANETVQRLLTESRTALNRQEQEQRAAAIAEAMQRFDALILTGDLAAAAASLDATVERIGEFKDARLVRSRLTAILGEPPTGQAGAPGITSVSGAG
jgi:serine/threonine protein kinase/tetratricopeptide (TPR) repeat protein